VSNATVSRVLSGVPTVDRELAARVRHQVELLGYRPSVMAQGLVRGRTGTVGVLVPDLANPYFYDVLHGIERAAERDDVWMFVADSHENPGGELDRALELARRVDGLVLCSPRMDEGDLKVLVERFPHVVCTHRSLSELSVPTVRSDMRRGTLHLLRHLQAVGHVRVAYFMGPPDSWSNAERMAAMREVDGLEIEYVECGSSIEDGYACAEPDRLHGVSAVMGYNDLVALGCLSRLAEEGVRVPDDIAVAGFDDIPFARFASPGLTTVRAATVELGAEAWRNLAALLEGRTLRPRTLPTELIVRGSTLATASRRVDRTVTEQSR